MVNTNSGVREDEIKFYDLTSNEYKIKFFNISSKKEETITAPPEPPEELKTETGVPAARHGTAVATSPEPFKYAQIINEEDKELVKEILKGEITLNPVHIAMNQKLRMRKANERKRIAREKKEYKEKYEKEQKEWKERIKTVKEELQNSEEYKNFTSQYSKIEGEKIHKKLQKTKSREELYKKLNKKMEKRAIINELFQILTKKQDNYEEKKKEADEKWRGLYNLSIMKKNSYLEWKNKVRQVQEELENSPQYKKFMKELEKRKAEARFYKIHSQSDEKTAERIKLYNILNNIDPEKYKMRKEIEKEVQKKMKYENKNTDYTPKKVKPPERTTETKSAEELREEYLENAEKALKAHKITSYRPVANAAAHKTGIDYEPMDEIEINLKNHPAKNYDEVKKAVQRIYLEKTGHIPENFKFEIEGQNYFVEGFEVTDIDKRTAKMKVYKLENN